MNLLDFLELRQVLSSYEEDLRDPLCWPQERPVPMRVARGPFGISLPSMPGPKTLSGVGAPTGGFLSCSDMDLGYVWSLPSGVSPRMEWGHARALSSRAVAAVSRFPSRGSRGLWVSHEAFPRGFPTGLSHVPPWCESILGLKVDAVQGKQVSLEWTETSGGLWEWWHNPGVPLAFPVESASSLDATETPGILSRTRSERIPPQELGGGNGSPLDVGGTFVLPLEWRRVCRGTS